MSLGLSFSRASPAAKVGPDMPPRSRIALIAVFLVVAAVCARLGVWQLHRLKERRAANDIALAARRAPAVRLNERTLDTSLAQRRVLVKGHYDHAHDIVLRGREYRGVPGVEIVSPLLIGDKEVAVLVNRGFVPAPDAVTVTPDSVREPGAVWVSGIALPIDSGRGVPLLRGGLTTWARLDRLALRSRLPYPVYPLYIQQLPDSTLPRFPRRLDPPALDDGPHLNYAIQWFGFAAIAVVFAGVITAQGPTLRSSSSTAHGSS
jgi:surfeit locus 1 family protein